MTKKMAQKMNMSSLNVLKTLLVLLEGEYTMNELIDILNSEEKEAIFNNSIISKYINTCRSFGIEILKIKNKYIVTKLPFGFDLSVEEASLIEALLDVARQEMSSKQFNIMTKLTEKINRYSNKNIVRVEKQEFYISVELFERAISNKHKVKLIFKNQAEIVGIPIKIVDVKDKIYFNVLCGDKDRMVDINRLSGIQETNEIFIQNYSDCSTVFVLKGLLAKRYSPREHERIELNLDGTLTVINKGENKELLFSRLLRYDYQCEIMTPKTYREEFRQLINNTLKNYGVV